VFDRLVFRYNLRFSLDLGVLRHCLKPPTAQFASAYRRGPHVKDGPDEIWNHLDLCFHDFGLITKEVLVALRAFLASMPDGELCQLTAKLNALVAQGVRTTNSAVRVTFRAT
jgi:hypothetical protein